jgi:hypothetical protein
LGLAVVFALACSGGVSSRTEGGVAQSAGNGGRGGSAAGESIDTAGSVSDGGVAGVAGEQPVGAGGRAQVYCSEAFDYEDECKKDYGFGSGEGGAIEGSESALAALVGSWKLAIEDGYVWTINADGTGSFTERGPFGSNESHVWSGTIHVGSVILVLDATTHTIHSPSGSETQTTSERLIWAYRYNASSDADTLCLGPPDCGIPSFDPFERL